MSGEERAPGSRQGHVGTAHYEKAGEATWLVTVDCSCGRWVWSEETSPEGRQEVLVALTERFRTHAEGSG